MAHTVGHWIEEEGLGLLSDLASIGGRAMDYQAAQQSAEQRAEVGRFNRQLDLANLALSRKHNERAREINRARAQESLADAAQAQAESDAHEAEARLHELEREYVGWRAASEARESRTRADAGYGVALREAGVRRAQLQARSATQAAEGVQLGTERTALAMTGRAARTTIAAGRESVGVQAAAGRMRDVAARGTLGAGRAALAGRRASIVVGGALRRIERVEQAQAEAGAATVSGAARGMRGSFRRTREQQAVAQLGRDLERYRLEDGLALLETSEAEARLEQQAVDLDAGAMERAARLGAEGAKLNEQQARLVAGEMRTSAEIGVREARLRGEVGTTAAERALESARGGLLDVERRFGRFSGEDARRIERKAGVDQAGLSLSAARSRLGARGAERTAEKARITARERTFEDQLGSMAEQVMDWQLRNLPDLPDYEAMGTRNALSMVFRTIDDLIED